MADATYDAVVIGAGNKALNLAMYLQRYGGMDVALFERRHEAGGGWTTDEGPAPGFLADYHASATGANYHMPVERDFPEWNELVSYNEVGIGVGAIFKDDDSSLITFNRKADPTLERTHASLARFSERDADFFVGDCRKLIRTFVGAYLEVMHTPPGPPGEPDAMERLLTDPNSGFDQAWVYMTPLEVARDLFESDPFISMILRNAMSAGNMPNLAGMGVFSVFSSLLALRPRTASTHGGTHQFAHAATKILLADGAKIFLQKEVDKVIIENGTATGVRLTDGTEIAARKMVVSTLDPYTLCFRLIGKEYLDSRILRKVANLSRDLITIAWFTWALNEFPNYKAASIEPDINQTAFIEMVSKDPEDLVREQAMRVAGIMPQRQDFQLEFLNYSQYDKARVPEGKCSVLSEQFVLSADKLTEAEWLSFKKKHAEDVLAEWQKHAPNMTWDNVIGYYAHTPYDCCELHNMAPQGNWAVIDHTASQMSRFRPISELSRYGTPINKLYATGAGWHPQSGANCYSAYCCYKVVADDLGLKKPWEGHPW